jgi:hypothetical protein
MNTFRKYLLSSALHAPETGAGSGGAEPSPAAAAPQSDTAVHIAGGEGPLSMRDAARSVIDWRCKSAAGASETTQATTPNTQDASAGNAATPERSAQAGDGGESPPVETESQDAATPELPPIDPPRSWSKEDKELFKALPRETQERLADRERSRDSDFSRRQQGATERAKAFQAEHAKVEAARGQYEQALPILLSNLQAAHSGEFADIRTMDDVQKLAVSDPIRYTQWDAAQKRMAAVHQEIVGAQERQAVERNQRLNQYRQREAELFAEKAPEFADEAQAKKLMDAAVTTLRDLGFADQELGELWRGERDISIHDHRLHLLLRDGIKWRDAQAQAKLKTSQARSLPPVQRPGVAQGANAAREAQLKTLEDNVNKSSGNSQLRAAARLLAERRRAG